ncbi:MAG: ABC transporter ATP-binding protein [Christensenellaceae bacterium]|nr:ABC transporter ATP-binding protein [Christensenellaceae bacterium]
MKIQFRSIKLDKNRLNTIGKLLKRLRPYRVSFVLSLVLAVISVVLTLYVPILIGRAVDCIVGAGEVDFVSLSSILIKIALCVGVNALCGWLMSLCCNKITYGMVKDIRTEAFRHVQKLPLSYLDAHPTGETVSRMISDVDQLADGLLMGFTQFFTGILTIIGTLIFMLTINPLITLVVVVITPLSLAVASFIAKRTYTMFKKQSEIRGEQTALIDEIISEQKVVQAFSYENRAEERFNEVNERLKKCSLRAVFFSSLTNPSTRFVNALVYAGVGVAGAFAAISGGLTIGGLSAFLSYANQYTKPFNEISGVVTELQGSLACAARLFELIEAQEQTPDPILPETPPNDDGRMEFRDVCFSYNKSRELIRDFSLTVHPGQRVAIVGPTGCGKTTLINLIMRFYDIDSGEITMDGINTQSMKRSELRIRFGMVLQDTWLKSGTIRENITMGRPDATDEEIMAAAISSHAYNFIRRLTNGFDTVIGESGGSLSLGQKQLLCIARVMLCMPPMLILDEATSSIDTRTEKHVQDAFVKLMRGRTTFIVAHRLSTIREADVILVMRDGRIIEKGRHDELIRKGGFYKELYESQFAH